MTHWLLKKMTGRFVSDAASVYGQDGDKRPTLQNIQLPWRETRQAANHFGSMTQSVEKNLMSLQLMDQICEDVKQNLWCCWRPSLGDVSRF